MPPRVLVTDAEDRSALAACRSLAEAGYGVSAVAGARPAPGHWSRSVGERIVLPHPRLDTAGFVAGIESEVAGGRYAMVLPGSDASLLAISAARDRIEPHARLGLPDHELVVGCFDKWRLAQIAAEAGLGSPETVLCESAEEALAAARGLGYPVVLKARRGVSIDGGRIRQRAARPVADEAALAEEIPRYGMPCLVQRPRAGALLSSAAVAVPGRLLGFGVSRYRRVFPPQAGSVSFSETVAAPGPLRDQVGRLVAAAGWQGIFELELIESATGELAAIDFNPRPFGSLSLSNGAGAPLAALWCDWVLRGESRPAPAREGVSYRWEDADLRHMLWQLRRGHLGAALEVAKPHRGVVHPHFRLRDPAPLLARFLLLLRQRLAGLRRRASAGR